MQILVGDEAHIYVYEAGGASALGGVAYHVIPNSPNGELPLPALQRAVRYATCLFVFEIEHSNGLAASRGVRYHREHWKLY